MDVIDLRKYKEKKIAEYSDEIQYFREDITEADAEWIEKLFEWIMDAVSTDKLTGPEALRHGLSMAFKKGKKAGRDLASGV